MPISHLEHFLLQTDDIDRTCDWYVEVLGFHVGPSPDFKFPVKWLYLGERDVIHVCEGGKGVSTAAGALFGFSVWLGIGTLATWITIAAFFRISSLAALISAIFAPMLRASSES